MVIRYKRASSFHNVNIRAHTQCVQNLSVWTFDLCSVYVKCVKNLCEKTKMDMTQHNHTLPQTPEESSPPSNPERPTYRTLWGTFKTPLKWVNIISIFLAHVITLTGFITFPYLTHKRTFFWSFLTGWIGGFGVTAGAHRLWSHKSYKARLHFRIILMLCFSMAGQNRMTEWVRDHRVHHKFSETDADPHNANRGFFFAHVGWLMMKKHPEVLKKGKYIDCTDLFQDPVIVFFEKWFWPMKLFFCFIFPTLVPYLLWNETLYWSVMNCIARYVCGLNFTWLVNSAAHMFGNKPYNRKIQPVENRVVSVLAMGEGWHNYHHTFPWDYKASELGNYGFNVTTLLLDMLATLGWVYDLKSPPKHLIQKIVQNHGDGTYKQ